MIGYFVDCDRVIEKLFLLGLSIRCVVFIFCSEIRCCIYFDILGENLEVYVDFDKCNVKVLVGIEKYYWIDKFIGYKFGDLRYVLLMGMVNLEYVVDLIFFFNLLFVLYLFVLCNIFF